MPEFHGAGVEAGRRAASDTRISRATVIHEDTIEEPPAKGLLHIDASVAANQIKKLQEMKAARDNVLVRQRLDALRTAAEGSDNLMPYILDCARVYCTEGEICGELRKVFGEYRPMEVL